MCQNSPLFAHFRGFSPVVLSQSRFKVSVWMITQCLPCDLFLCVAAGGRRNSCWSVWDQERRSIHTWRGGERTPSDPNGARLH